jgi:hypothetical protein
MSRLTATTFENGPRYFVCLGSQRLWGHLTGHTPRPSIPVRPTEPTTGMDGASPSDEAQADYTAAVSSTCSI